MPKLLFSFEEVHNGEDKGGAFFHVIKCANPHDQRYEDYLGGMLSTDIGKEDCRSLIEKATKAESGPVANWDFTGNAWVTDIRNDGVYITHQYVEELQDEALGRFELREFKIAVAAWERFLSMKPPAMLDVDLG